MAYSQGIPLKKQFGQHFLRDVRIVHNMIFAVEIKPTTSIFEIGCGDGFFTIEVLKEILNQKPSMLIQKK